MAEAGWAGRPARDCSRAAILSTAAALTAVLAAAGCGGGEVAEGATVTLYVSAPLCKAARKELARRGGRAGSVRVRASCLEEAESGGHLNLARTGANARRVSEDATAVGLVAPPGRETAFAQPILSEAGIALITSRSGAETVDRVLADLESRGEGSPREAVAKAN